MTTHIIDYDEILGKKIKLIELLEKIGIADIDIMVCNIIESNSPSSIMPARITFSFADGTINLVAYELKALAK